MVVHRFCGEGTIRDEVDSGLQGLLQTPVQAKVPVCVNLPEENVFSIVQAAGWPIWPLLLASIIAVALILERLVALRRSKVVPPGLLQRVVTEYRQNGVNAAMVGDLESSLAARSRPRCRLAQCRQLARDHEGSDRGSW
jgi:hypothetical protein